MEKKVLVPIADGCEEIEAVCIIDVLRRAGASVTVAAVGERRVTASRGVVLEADCILEECAGTAYDLIALPGGMPGAERLHDSTALASLLRKQSEEGRLYAAICAAPAVVLQPLGLLSGRRATAHPAFMDRLDLATAVEDRVAVDPPCTTSRAPGTALEFALSLVAQLFGEEKAADVAEPMLVPWGRS